MKDFWVVALMLFSMFFGAGNFIFPPVVGAAASEFFAPTLAFTLSAVALPVLGIAAVAKAGSLGVLGARVHPIFAAVFSIAIYLCIGPLFAIPRASNMPLQLAAPNPDALTQVIYSGVYYLLNFYLCLNPSKLIDALGKFITPMLIIVLAVLITGVLTVAPEQAANAGQMGAGRAFVEGYSTMDALASLVFGTSVLQALRLRKMPERSLARSCVLAGLVAGVILAAVYVGLSFCGWRFSAHAGSDGAVLLGALSAQIFGEAGRWVLAAACFLACFSTTLGLIGSGAQHFSSIGARTDDGGDFEASSESNRLGGGKVGGYRLWVGIYCVLGFAMSNLGLAAIIDASVQALILLYPLAILLIASAFLPRCDWALRASVAVALGCSLAGSGWLGGAAAQVVAALPGQGDGLGWMLPAVAAWAFAWAACAAKARG